MIETRKNFSRMILGKILVEKIRRLFPSVRGEARPPAFGPLSKFGGGRLYLDAWPREQFAFNCPDGYLLYKIQVKHTTIN